ncbi:MAG: RNA polymerase sigma factor [Thiotrichaceae bacterium]
MLLATQSESPSINVQDYVIPPDQVTDEDIIKRIKAGDVDAYGSILRRYNQRIFRIARSIVTNDAAAMDIVQEAHIKAYTKLDTFKGNSTFFSWLASITRNEALMYLRKHKREVSMLDDEMDFLEPSISKGSSVDHNELPDAFLENKQLQQLINHNIDKLPEDFRIVFVLRAIEQFSVKEVADILEIKEETVKTRYFRAKRLLRGQIQVYVDSVGMKIYEFGGHHCDIIVDRVMNFIHKESQ